MNNRILAFQNRMETELEFCKELFHYATVRLLAHKYSYYILSKEIIRDAGYDAEEESWRVMGRALGFLTEEETSPCIDFDYKHPMANEAIKLAIELKPK